ncbi:MAG: hypothetical protein HQK55_06070 [Deltaproteobacteria bacterium]|nr:hypothetical protein [Deltaproteobacteria bacterium]
MNLVWGKNDVPDPPQEREITSNRGQLLGRMDEQLPNLYIAEYGASGRAIRERTIDATAAGLFAVGVLTGDDRPGVAPLVFQPGVEFAMNRFVQEFRLVDSKKNVVQAFQDWLVTCSMLGGHRTHGYLPSLSLTRKTFCSSLIWSDSNISCSYSAFTRELPLLPLPRFGWALATTSSKHS